MTRSILLALPLLAVAGFVALQAADLLDEARTVLNP